MNYIEVNYKISPYSENIADAIISELGDIGYESFSYTDTGFNAYIQIDQFDILNIENLETVEFFSNNFDIQTTIKEIEQQNWNKLWEDNFTPIIVDNKIQVRAKFHPADPDIKYDIIIEPKMSFGTGHHSTTALMLGMILDKKNKIEHKKVLDMGCGTAILSIMASKVGAAHVLGIDIDEWAYHNAFENINNNNLNNIDIKIGDATLLKNEDNFDIILANINRNILLEDMHNYIDRLNSNGYLIMSGFYLQDLAMIQAKAEELGLKFEHYKEENQWTSASFYKE